MKSKIFLDMDGLLADLFNTISHKIYGKEYKNLTQTEKREARIIWKDKNEFNKHFGSVEDFFANLEPFEGKTNEIVRVVVEFTKKNNDIFEEGYDICSHPASIDSKASENGKRAWIQKHLLIPPNEQHFPDKKSIFAKGKNGVPNILIDDFPPYIQAWGDTGGIPIEMRTDAVSNVSGYLLPKLEQAKSVIASKQSVRTESFNEAFVRLLNTYSV